MSEFEPAFNTAFASKVTEQVTAKITEWHRDPNSWYVVVLPEGCEDFRSGDVVVHVVYKETLNFLDTEDAIADHAYRTFHFVDGQVVEISSTEQNDIAISYSNDGEGGVSFIIGSAYYNRFTYKDGVLIDAFNIGLPVMASYTLCKDGFVFKNAGLTNIAQGFPILKDEQTRMLLGEVTERSYSFDDLSELLSGSRLSHDLIINRKRGVLYPNYLLPIESTFNIYLDKKNKQSVTVFRRSDGKHLVFGIYNDKPLIALVNSIDIAEGEAIVFFEGEAKPFCVKLEGNDKIKLRDMNTYTVGKVIRFALRGFLNIKD